MEKQDILDMLDALDMQITLGKIDQSTYTELRGKWLQKLQAFDGSNPVSISGIQPPLFELPATTVTEIETYNCPTCGTPADQNATGPIQCQYCGTTFTPTASVSKALSVSGSSAIRPAGNVSMSQVSTPASTIVQEVTNCPICGGPPTTLDDKLQDLTKPIKCKFCGNVYTIRQSQDNDQKMQAYVNEWMEQSGIARSIGSGNSSAIDLNARHSIFEKDVYPSIKKEVDRYLEPIEFAPEAPMVQIKLTTSFKDFQPHGMLVTVGQGNNQWLKTLVSRVSAQQLHEFAVVPADKTKLKTLQFRAQSLVYYGNIAFQLANPGVATYEMVRQNLLALQKDYQEHAQDITDADYRSYLDVMDARITGVLLLLDTFIMTLDSQNQTPIGTILNKLAFAIMALLEAEIKAIECKYTPLYTVPLQQGIQKDTMVASIFRAVVKCYEIATQSQSIAFPSFYDQLLDYVRNLTTIQSPSQLLGLIESISLLLDARSANEPIRVLMDWSWVDGIVESNRLKPVFGTPETVGAVLRQTHPKHTQHINYAEKSGFFTQKGTGREALIFVDATSAGTPLIGHLLVNDPNLSVLQTGADTLNTLDKETLALPAVLSQDMAEKAMKGYTHQHATELGATLVKMIGLVYIPAAFVRYVNKKGERELTLSRLNLVNQNIKNMLSLTNKFLRDHSI